MIPKQSSLRRIWGQRGQILTETAILFFFLSGISLVILVGGPIFEKVSNDLTDALNGQWFDLEPVVQNPGGPDSCVTWILGDQHGGSYCDQHEECDLIDNAPNDGNFISDSTVYVIVVKGGQEYHVFKQPGVSQYTTDDGCYQVVFQDTYIEWHKIGQGHTCKNVSHVESWRVPFCDGSQYIPY